MSTATRLNLGLSGRARTGWPCLRRIVAIMGIVVAAVVSHAAADEIDPVDLHREFQAMEALRKDPQLGALNLGVRVRGRVATLWGPIPTRDLADRAVATLKKLPELREVRDHTFVQFDELRPKAPVGLPPTQEVAPPPVTPKTEPATAKAEPAGPQVAIWRPVLPEVESKPLPNRPSVALLPSLVGPGSMDVVSRAKDKGPTLEPLDAAAIGSAVQSLVQSEARFRRVRYEVKQSKVYLSGVVIRWADLHELSLAVTRIPGVESVVLRDVRMEPRK